MPRFGRDRRVEVQRSRRWGVRAGGESGTVAALSATASRAIACASSASSAPHGRRQGRVVAAPTMSASDAAPASLDEEREGAGENGAPAPAALTATVDRAKLTPLFQHFVSIKDAHPDYVVLYQCGDFFECFFEDAHTLHAVLELALTSKEAGKEIGRVAMAGVPLAALDRHCATLLARGYNVAVVEQVEPASEAAAGALVRREVTRKLTPGTVLEDALLDARRNNYLAALVPSARRPLRQRRRDDAAGRHDGCEGVAAEREEEEEAEDDGDGVDAVAPFGFAYVDVSTGEFCATQLHSRDELVAELGRVAPTEVIVPDNVPRAGERSVAAVAAAAASPSTRCTARPARDFEGGAERIAERFGLLSSEALTAGGDDGMPLATAAAGGLLAFIRETMERRSAPETNQNGAGAAAVSLQRPRVYRREGYMVLDATALRNLEIVSSIRDSKSHRGSLLWAVDATVTAMGGRMLRRWLTQPLCDASSIAARHERVEYWSGVGGGGDARRHRERSELRRELRLVSDLERLVGRAAARRATPRELHSLARSLCRVPRLPLLPTPLSPQRGQCGAAHRENGAFPNADAVVKLAQRTVRALVDPPPAALPDAADARRVFCDGYDVELDALRERASGDARWFAEYEAKERRRIGVPQLRVGYNSVFGYYVQMPRSVSAPLPPEYARRQTLKSAERYVTPELREREQRIFAAKARLARTESSLFAALRDEFAAHVHAIRAAAAAIAELDVLVGFAEIAARRRYARPTMLARTADGDARVLRIDEGRHAVVERTLPPGTPFVPNSVSLGSGTDLITLTGPNAAGKSVYLRQIGLIQILAQAGSFVPARAATLAVADRVFTRVGAVDDIAARKSTFVVEMLETAAILQHATPTSLVLLDEIGRGTATIDGVSIARAVAEYLAGEAVRARCVFATHFHELNALARERRNVANFKVKVVERGDEVCFLHKVEPGGADKSFGVEVARLAGLPEVVVARARQLMKEAGARDRGGSRDGGGGGGGESGTSDAS